MRTYSSTPLHNNLNIKEGFSLYVKNAPISHQGLCDGAPKQNSLKNKIGKNLDFIHLFVTTKSELEKFYLPLFKSIKQSGILWISWPKDNTQIEAGLNRDDIKAFVLESDLVDAEVCSVNNNWSALKFFYRKKDRK